MTLELTDKERMDLIHCVSSTIYRNNMYIGNLMITPNDDTRDAIENYRRDNDRLEELKKKIIFEVKI